MYTHDTYSDAWSATFTHLDKEVSSPATLHATVEEVDVEAASEAASEATSEAASEATSEAASEATSEEHATLTKHDVDMKYSRLVEKLLRSIDFIDEYGDNDLISECRCDCARLMKLTEHERVRRLIHRIHNGLGMLEKIHHNSLLWSSIMFPSIKSAMLAIKHSINVVLQ
jgi:soluble cytochrome b562